MLTERSTRIRQARKLTRRAGREKAGLFLAEGGQAVSEAVAASGPTRQQATRPAASRGDEQRVVEIFATPAAHRRHAAIVEAAERAGIDVHLADDAALAELSETVTPQGIVAVCRPESASLADVLGPPQAPEPTSATLVPVLVEAQDPGNVGTVIRCADAAGADAVLLTAGSADPYGGKAVRASVGSVFHLPIVSGVEVVEAIDQLRSAGLTVLAADGAGAWDLDDADAAGVLSAPVAWLFGNEARGLPDAVRRAADYVVRVPIYGQAESLNLATASAVCLYATARAQRR